MKKANLLFHTTFTIRIGLVLLLFFLIYNGWGVYSGGQEQSLFMYSNLTSFSFWVIFLMGSIFLAPLGRVFCGICPAGELNFLSSKIGLKRPVNMNFSILQVISLTVVFVMVIIFHFSRHPHYTSILMGAVAVLCVILGLIFKGNAFCLLLCPANAYLRIYSRLSFLTLKADKECAVSEPCMVMLNPCSVKKEQCHLCFRCFKNSEGLSLSVENPLKSNAFSAFNNQEIFIFTALTGITFMAFIRVVREVREFFVYPPYLLSQALGISEQNIIYVVAVFGIIVYPSVLYLLYSVPVRLFAGKGLMETAREYLPFMIFPVLAVHYILALIKINSRIGFLPYALKDPSGKDMTALYAAQKIDIPSDIISVGLLRYIIAAIPLLLLGFGMAMFLKNNTGPRPSAAFIGMLVVFFFVETSVFLWLFKGGI